MIIDSSDDEDSGTQPEAISSGMVIEVQQAGLRTQDEHGPQRTQFTEVKSDNILEPGSYAEAIACDQHVGWKNAMREEFASLKSNETWVYVKAGEKHAIGSRWVYRKKV